MAYVYWITENVNLDIRTNGYVGITTKTVNERIKSHKYNYKRFCNGKEVGCKKLYSILKRLGGWDTVTIVVLCEADIRYCLDIEFKLRSTPDVGFNTRVGGDAHVMFKRTISEATRLKLAAIRKKWVMSPTSRIKLSIDRKEAGNPMFGTPPWDNPAATPKSKETWYFADTVYSYWFHNKQGVRKTIKSFLNLNYWTVDSMIRKFKTGWIPREDKTWLKYKESMHDCTQSKT